ncbi:MAG TPA: acetate--CoA ligase family protein [Xanthobacteraceae bacterium]|nr:acetate--CoA ligase family protein [Xanthobacteraceae bacterium]
MPSLRQVLLSPRSVAIVGQSNDAGKAAGRPLKFLRQAGYAGRIYPVNARRDVVLGERAYPSLAALPEVPEHVYIVAPTEAAVAAVEECGALGVKVATVLADGFAEAGAAGQAREARLRAVVANTGLRLVGPSSLGVVNLRDRVMLTANAALDEPDLVAGRIFAASHSGTMIGALASRGKARHIGFAGLVSVGNEVDLSIGEVCAATLDDPDIDGYLLFLESLRKAETLRAFALAAAARGKPVLAYKLGRSAAARELAVSHTGALAGEDDVADTFLAECGIARVETFEALIEGLPLLARVPARPATARPPTVAVVTTTAGGATTVVDPLGVRGITIAQPSAETFARLAAAGIKAAQARIVDLTIAGAHYEAVKGALDILLTAPEFDLVVAVIGSSARSQPEKSVKPIIDSAGAARPLAAFLVPDAPAALAQLAAAGVPAFRTPEACADAIAAALRRRLPRAPDRRRAVQAGAGRLLDEREAYALLDRIGIARAPAVALDAGIGAPPELPFPYPVAVKTLGDIAHKSDIGGVVLGVTDGAALLAAVAAIRASLASHGRRLERVLVQPMITGIGEVLVGYRVDRDVGPLVMVAAGGLFTEIYRDRSLRLAPVDLDTAHEMIAELRACRILAGMRGRPPGDLMALAGAIVALSRLASDDSLLEAEINPLIVRRDGEGVIAVDAVVQMLL